MLEVEFDYPLADGRIICVRATAVILGSETHSPATLVKLHVDAWEVQKDPDGSNSLNVKPVQPEELSPYWTAIEDSASCLLFEAAFGRAA